MSCFFYGTLLHPSVLSRVIGREDKSLITRDAILPAHTRHHVKLADYPAIIPASNGTSIIGRELTEDEANVRGSLVQGLTEEDLALLDEFEGDEYRRQGVEVIILESGEAVPAHVYIWCAPVSRLEPSLWSFQDFLRDKAHRWVGTGASADAEYLEVDRRRAMGGLITPNSGEEAEKVPAFGKELRERYWSFEEGYINVNHGSYGAAPIPVMKAVRDIQDRSAAAPDRFMRIDYMGQLAALRGRLGKFVNCDAGDLVLVTNATSGVNIALRALTTVWEKNDAIMYFTNTIYNACGSSIRYVIDTHPHLSLQEIGIPLTYPISHAEVISAVKEAIATQAAKGVRIRLALIDAISSNPGVIVPWQQIVPILRENGIISLIDAAHEIGQLPVNMQASQPDFWVSNCHKWLMSSRAAAVLYVSKEHQHLVHSFPTGHFYGKRDQQNAAGWIDEFEWNGTLDWSPFLSIGTALDFRELLGGETKITEYCHRLALDAGKVVADALGTETMGNDEELVANMINVRLPIDFIDDVADTAAKRMYLTERQILEHKTIAPAFVHDKIWWVRLSAQVYNDIDDFAYVGRVLNNLCAKVRSGEYKQAATV